MARGNDADAATEALKATVGDGIPSADEMIAAHRATIDPAVQAAGMKQPDEDQAKVKDLSKIKPAEEGSVVIAATVRAGVVSYVAEREDGTAYKGIVK